VATDTNNRLPKRRLNVDIVYKIERNGWRSKYYVIKRFLCHKQLENFHIEDSDLGTVSNLLSYADAKVSCDRLNREQVEAEDHCDRLP
jgi:hypothetical protein